MGSCPPPNSWSVWRVNTAPRSRAWPRPHGPRAAKRGAGLGEEAARASFSRMGGVPSMAAAPGSARGDRRSQAMHVDFVQRNLTVLEQHEIEAAQARPAFDL